MLALLTGCHKQKSGAMATAAPPTSVVAAVAKKESVTETLSLVGTIAANEIVELKSEVDGIVEEINFQEGQRVKKGDLLVRLEETKLKAALTEAEANFRLSQSTYDRAQQLFKDKLISQQEFDQAASTFQSSQASQDLKRRLLRDTRIVAPFSGVVSARNISPGQVIGAMTTTLTWLVDFDRVKVEINVPERFLSQLQLEQTIEISVATYGARKFQGKVYFIAPQIDPATRTALVKAEIANPKLELHPGMFANLDLTLKIRENAIVIPEIALAQLQEGDRAVVYVVEAGSTAQPHQIKLGVRLPGKVEVLEGLKGGEHVIVEGLQKIGPGAPVTEAKQ
jgi:membrane fusion protein (multidrug efflux system)